MNLKERIGRLKWSSDRLWQATTFPREQEGQMWWWFMRREAWLNFKRSAGVLWAVLRKKEGA